METKNIIYNAPAETFDESFPMGNGRLGACMSGGTGREIIQLNEESIWSGAWYDRNNKFAKNSIKKIRTLLNQNRKDEAFELMDQALSGTSPELPHYKSAGKLVIDFYDGENNRLDITGKNTPDAYRRTLNLDSGISTVSFSTESVQASTADFSQNSTGSSIEYTREAFVSSSQDVIVLHFSASTPKSIFLKVHFENKHCAKKTNVADDTIAMLDVTGVPYAALATAVSSGGTVEIVGENIVVEKADEVTLYVDIETAYNFGHYRKKFGDVHMKPLSAASKCADKCLKKICFASGTSYENLRVDQATEFHSWYSSLEFTDTSGLISKEFNYALYKLISSAKAPGKLPPLRNGLWTDSDSESSKYYIPDFYLDGMAGAMCGNEKLEAGTFNLMKNLYKHGKSTAESMYGELGFAAHYTTNIWGDSAPGKVMDGNYFPTGSAYASLAIVEYYEWTLDKRFLRKNLKKMIKACSFFISSFVEENSQLVLLPHVEDGAIVRELFESTLKAMKYLGKNDSDDEYIKILSVLRKLPKEENGMEKLVNKMYVSNMLNNGFKSSITSFIETNLSSRIENNRVEIFLNAYGDEGDSSSQIPSVTIKNLCLKGNIICDVEYENGQFKCGRLFTHQNKDYIKDIAVTYKNHRYETRMESGTMDLRNIIPTTL